MRNKAASIFGAVFAVILIFGCTLPGDDTIPDSNNENTSIPETTKVLEESDLSQISSIADNSISFSQPMDIEIGDIIVGGISTKTPNGLLRKVENASNSGQEFQTSQATLEDAIESCQIQFSNQLTSSSIRASSSIQGANRAVTADGFDFGININDVVLYDYDGNLTTTTDQIRANGFLQFNLTFGFALKISNFTIEELSFQGEVQEELELEITGELGVPATERIILTEYLFSPFVAAIIPSIPPIPIVLIPKITIYLDLQGSISAELTTDVQQGASLTTELNYSESYWSPSVQFEKHFEYSPPSFSSGASTKVSAGSMLGLSLYGVAGPYLDTSAYLAANASTSSDTLYWQISSGIDVGAGVYVSVLGWSLADYQTSLLNYEKILASGEQAITTEPPTDNRFTDMGNGTIRDNNTNLIWTKNANLYGQMNWDAAHIAATQIHDGRHGIEDGSSAGDWRLPEISELQSLVSEEISNPAVPDTSGDEQWSSGDPFINLIWVEGIDSWHYMYWSSTESPPDLMGNVDYALILEFSYGDIAHGLKTSNQYTWFVRDARPDEL